MEEWRVGYLIGAENMHLTVPVRNGVICSRTLWSPEKLLSMTIEEVMELKGQFPEVLPIDIMVKEYVGAAAGMALFSWSPETKALEKAPDLLISHDNCKFITSENLFRKVVVRHELSHVVHKMRQVKAGKADWTATSEHGPEWEAVAKEMGVVALPDEHGVLRLDGYWPPSLGIPLPSQEERFKAELYMLMTTSLLYTDPRTFSATLALRSLA